MRRFHVACGALVTTLASAGCGRCGSREASSGDGGAPPSSAAGDAASPAVLQHKKGGTDVTFLVISDTHFGYEGIEEAHRSLIPQSNGIAGKPYPPALRRDDPNAVVAPPRGLLITGDLTEWGKVEEWEPFVATYGLTGKEGKLAIPVFEVIGNHDKVAGPWVEQQVAARHGGARFHSWSWDDVHFDALGEAPDEEGLSFLARDLAQLAPDVPVVLYFHLALLGPWSTGNWFADGNYKGRLQQLCEGHNVIAIFHGHHHATDHYRWHGIDVFKPGAVKNGAHTFAVVHVSDRRMTVASYDWDASAWAGSFTKGL